MTKPTPSDCRIITTLLAQFVAVVIAFGLGAFAHASAVPAEPSVQYTAPSEALAAWSPLGSWAPSSLRSGHGWFIAPRTASGEAPLVHIPPRGQGTGSGLTARLAALLLERPAAIAAAGNTVYVVFRPEPVGAIDASSVAAAGAGSTAGVPRRLRRVVTLDAVRLPIGTWESVPLDRTVALPSLPGDVELLALTATASGPVALLRDDDASTGRAGTFGWRMVTLYNGQWRDVQLPPDSRLQRTGSPAARLLIQPAVGAEGSDMMELWLNWPGEPAVVWHAPLGAPWQAALTKAHVAELAAKNADDADKSGPSPATPVRTVQTVQPIAVNWQTPDRVKRGAALPAGLTLADAGLAWIDGRLIAWTVKPVSAAKTKLSDDHAVVELYAQLPSGSDWARLAALDVGSQEIAVVPNPGLARVSLVWSESVSGQAAGSGGQRQAVPAGDLLAIAAAAERAYSVRVVSTIDGEVIESEAMRSRSPFGVGEFYLLAAVFGGLLAVVVVFVMRSERPSDLPMPDGASLCSPVRRLMAALIDFVPGVLVSSAIVGMPVSELAGLGMVADMNQTLEVVGLSLLIAGAYSSLAEAVWGRSVGKIAMGMYVIGYRKVKAPVAGKAAGDVPSTSAGPDEQHVNVVRIGSWELGPPTIAQACLRNMVRWCLLPLSLTVLFDNDTRHPGDLLANTLVVVRQEPEPEDDQDPFDD